MSLLVRSFGSLVVLPESCAPDVEQTRSKSAVLRLFVSLDVFFSEQS